MARPRVQAGTKKCTEPVSPLSGFLTDRRRSDCLSESHQPRALRTRCKQHTRGARKLRQGRLERTLRKLRSFLFTQGRTAISCVCSGPSERRKRARHDGPAPKSSPSRERFRPPSRRTFRFRVVLLGGLRPTGAPCSAQQECTTADLSDQGVFAKNFPANSEERAFSRSRPGRSSTRGVSRAARARGGAHQADEAPA